MESGFVISLSVSSIADFIIPPISAIFSVYVKYISYNNKLNGKICLIKLRHQIKPALIHRLAVHRLCSMFRAQQTTEVLMQLWLSRIKYKTQLGTLLHQL